MRVAGIPDFHFNFYGQWPMQWARVQVAKSKLAAAGPVSVTVRAGSLFPLFFLTNC